MRPAVHTALVGAVIGYLFGHWLGNALAPNFAPGGAKYGQALGDSFDMPIILGYVCGTLGWLGGLGVFNDIGRLMLGKPLPDIEHEHAGGLAKYFRYTLDHKVVGIQYLFGMITYFLTGGLFAMAIRTELLSPSYHVLTPSAYLMVVGEHGTMMMMMMTSVIVGPLGNYLVPLMIGSKRVAFPRVEALSFWLTPCAYIVLLSGTLFGGWPNGWTGYAPLSLQAGEGMDSYAVAFSIMGFSVILAGFNLICTIICYRAPGMRWG
ncbi:MAG TPA: cbb3-type cytochrome c oxidase subunit I, partial [Streptosporangiaceae bacterium]